MIRHIYTAIYYLLSPLMCVRWFLKSLKPPKYREPFRQRFGFIPKSQNTDIWFHAVSMGEASGAVLIIKKLLNHNPQLNIVVTTTTQTGARLVLDSLEGVVQHYYSPCDLPGSIQRFIKSVKPKLVIIMETELWPNWIYYLSKINTPMVLANARLSESSASKYGVFAKTAKGIFSKFIKILAVNSADAKRFSQLGALPDSIEVTGNIKFDAEFPSIDSSEYYPFWNDSFTWIAASTHPGEDEEVLKAHRKLISNLPHAKLIIVPRHPERFDSVAKLIQSEGFSLARRSDQTTWSEKAEVFLGDTMGELLLAYQKADIAFIGGSLVNIGGHNAIEAAYYTKPIITGSIYHNFQYLFDSLLDLGALKVVESADELSNVIYELSNNSELCKRMGQNAKDFVDQNKGALDKVTAYIQSII